MILPCTCRRPPHSVASAPNDECSTQASARTPCRHDKGGSYWLAEHFKLALRDKELEKDMLQRGKTAADVSVRLSQCCRFLQRRTRESMKAGERAVRAVCTCAGRSSAPQVTADFLRLVFMHACGQLGVRNPHEVQW